MFDVPLQESYGGFEARCIVKQEIVVDLASLAHLLGEKRCMFVDRIERYGILDAVVTDQVLIRVAGEDDDVRPRRFGLSHELVQFTVVVSSAVIVIERVVEVDRKDYAAVLLVPLDEPREAGVVIGVRMSHSFTCMM